MHNIYKYEATGNDFILMKETPKNPSKFAQMVCDRHFGIGADGILFPSESKSADIKMNYYNADGTVAPMCGNGIRAFSKFLHDQKIINKEQLHIETLAGIMIVTKENDLYEVNMGNAQTNLKHPDILKPQHDLEVVTLKVDKHLIDVYVLNLGTLHTIVLTNDLNQYDDLADQLCHHPFFPNRSNINFVKVIDKNHLELKTYERGVGWTLSCGTGSSASQYLTYVLGLTNDCVDIKVPGGQLKVRVENEKVYLKGPAQLIANISFQRGLI